VEQNLYLGTLTFVIYNEDHGVKLTELAKQKIAYDLISFLNERIKKNGFIFDIRFEVLSIQDGCVKVILSAILTVTIATGQFVLKYKDFRENLLQMKEDYTYFTSNGVACRANLHTEQLTKDVYGPIKIGENLSSIVKNWSCPGYSEKQKMEATLNANPNAFINGDINKLKKGVMLVFPTNKSFKGVLK